MREFEDLRHHLGVVGRSTRRYHRYHSALQLGLGLGQNFVKPLCFDHGKALQPQHRQKLVPRHIRSDGFVGGQVDGAFDARVHHQAAFGERGQSPCHRFDVGVDKVQCDGRTSTVALRHQVGRGRQQGAERQQTKCISFELQHGHPHLNTVVFPCRWPSTPSKLARAASLPVLAWPCPSKNKPVERHSPLPLKRSSPLKVRS